MTWFNTMCTHKGCSLLLLYKLVDRLPYDRRKDEIVRLTMW
jgi:hypothetical protein